MLWLAVAATAAATPIPTTITTAKDASASELHAAASLLSVLNQISGGSVTPAFQRATASPALAGTPQIAVGYGAAIALGAPATSLEGLGLEGFVATTAAPFVPPGSVMLSGGKAAARGALYAANNFTDAIGVLYLAQDTTVLPAALPPLPSLNPGACIRRPKPQPAPARPLALTIARSLALTTPAPRHATA
jgi:hypothetical protein